MKNEEIIDGNIKTIENEIDCRFKLVKAKLDRMQWKFKSELEEIRLDLVQ